MPNPYGIPEVTAEAVAEMLKNNEKVFVVDVREMNEVNVASISHSSVLVVPMSSLVQEKQEAFPAEVQGKDTAIITMCHHGIRSAQAAAWMMSEGWTNVKSMTGGIDAYAREVDSSVNTY